MNKVSIVLFVLGTPLLLVGMLSTSVVASLFNFSLFHSLVENSAISVSSFSALDTSIINTTGGFLDFGSIVGIFFIASSVVTIAFAVAKR